MVLTITLALVCIALSAFFSASETAFVTANKLGIEVLKNKGHNKGKIIAGFYEKPREFLSSMLVGNNIVLVLGTIFISGLIEPILTPYLGDDTIALLLTVSILITIVILILGEFLPKTFSQLFSNEYLYKMAYPMRFFMWLLFVPTWLLTKISNFFIKKVFRITGADHNISLSRIDLEDFINENVSEEEDIDKEILTNALNLDQFKVKDCMIPRNEIVYQDKKESLETTIALFQKHKISRIIVVDDDIENVIGYIHHQRLLHKPANIEEIIKPISFVPEVMGAKELLNKFITERFNIACVVDEYGGLSGLITLEDILEEIFGEIEDEHDIEGMIEEKISEDEFIFAGRIEVDYINEKYPHLNLPEGDYQTISGLIVKSEETIPEQGAEIIINNNKFILESVSETRIEKVRIIRLHGENNE